MTKSLQEQLAELPEEIRNSLIDKVPEAGRAALMHDWRGYRARSNQLPPGTPGSSNPRKDWIYWNLQAGRGFGKTKTGAETIREWVDQGFMRFHLVGPTASDARDVMIQGQSGLLSCFPPARRPLYEPSKRLITFDTGAVAYTFSADEPERLRGPQCERGWCDEIAAWKYPEAWDNFVFGLRLGSDPKAVVTSTPKPVKLVRDLVKDPNTVVTYGSSYENRSNLAPAFFNAIIRKYEGTRLGRQELMGELLEDIPGALWTRSLIEATRITMGEVRWELIVRIVVAIDPAVTASEESDETGIVVCGLTRSGHVLVLDDLSCRETPLGWAKVAVAAYYSRRADRIVGEVNNGGDLVAGNIRAVAPDVPFRAVRASRGKALRAEPVSALYEQGRVHHVGGFELMEDQMCLVAGTLITTRRGHIPIEQVRVGDYALTRIGWCLVTASGFTGEKSIVTIATKTQKIRLSNNHPVWCDGKFIPSFQVQKGSILLTCHTQSRTTSSRLTGRDSFGTSGMVITKPAAHEGDSCCTEKFGSRLTGRYRTDGMSTTATKIGAITIHPTLRHSLLQIISNGMDARECSRKTSRLARASAKPNGLHARNGGYTAKSAESPRWLEATGHVFVEAIVETVTASVYPEAVYNLTVAEQPEFCANGILVHNCSYVPGVTEKSPDRMDALVWAITELVVDPEQIEQAWTIGEPVRISVI